MARSSLSLAAVLLFTGAVSAGELKSGLQVNDVRKKFLVPFLNGKEAGKTRCPI
jgi:hypothetical protein